MTITRLETKLRRAAHNALEELFPNVLHTAVRQAKDQGWRIDASNQYCRRCGSSVGPGCSTLTSCPRCLGHTIPWDRIVRLNAYTPPLSQWIVSMKYARAWTWGPWLGRQLAQVVHERRGHTDRPIVCPVPMHWVRRLYRGYNQAQLIAAALARQLGWPTGSWLRRVRYTRPQVGVPPSQRSANIRRSIAVAKIDLTGWDVWLVDDVKTTGSTLAACARLLRRAGARNIHVAVAAVADPQGGDFKFLSSPPRAAAKRREGTNG